MTKRLYANQFNSMHLDDATTVRCYQRVEHHPFGDARRGNSTGRSRGKPPSLRSAVACSLMALLAVLGPPDGVEAAESRTQAPQGAGCAITKDDGTPFLDTNVTDCGSYYVAGHSCSSANAEGQRPDVCANIDMFMGVDWSGVDLIINSHRGVWGLKLTQNAATTGISQMTIGGAPENSIGGYEAARYAGFRSVEYDVFLAEGANINGPSARPYVTHFADLAGFTDYAGPQYTPPTGKATPDGGYLMNVPKALADGLYLRDRNGDLTPKNDFNKFVSLKKFLQHIRDTEPSMAVVLDLKYAKEQVIMMPGANPENKRMKDKLCVGFCGGYPDTESGQYVLSLIQMIVSTAKSINMEDNIIIKVPQISGVDVNTVINAVPNDFCKILWAPQPDAGRSANNPDNKDKILSHLTNWWTTARNQCDASSKPNLTSPVAFWDTTIYVPEVWMGREFTYNGAIYADLMDYLRVLSGRRSAFWTPDPSGPGGRHGNYAHSWSQYGNDPLDHRGDAVANLVFSGSTHAVVTSDRPDLIIQIREYLKTLTAPMGGKK